MRPLPTRSLVSRVPLPRSPALRTQATLARMVVGIFGHIRGGSWIEKQHDVLHLRSDLFEHFEPLRGHGSFRNHSLRQRRQSARQGPRCRPVGRPTTHPTWAGFAVAVGLRGWPCSAAFDPRAPSLTSSQLSANRSQTCAMWARVAPASRSLNVPAISRQARRRYPSALLATIHSPVRAIDDERGQRHSVRFPWKYICAGATLPPPPSTRPACSAKPSFPA